MSDRHDDVDPKLRLVLCVDRPATWQWMTRDGWSEQAGPKDDGSELEWRPVYAAAPGRGLVTAEMLESAARERYERVRARTYYSDLPPWWQLANDVKMEMIEDQRAAFEAIGLPVEEIPY